MTIWLLFLVSILVATTTTSTPSAAAVASKGQWQILQKSIGIIAMHMQLLHNDRIIIYDRTDFGFSNLSLPNGTCRHDPTEEVVKFDCTAHAVEYDVLSNTFRPLFVQTDVWCSSGSVSPDGTLVQTGGHGDGDRIVRTFSPCPTCDWREFRDGLLVPRWYATNHKLPDGRHIIIGGIRQFNYEFFPKNDVASKRLYSLPFLKESHDLGPGEDNNLYPFVFLNVDGNLFIFANNRAILFDYTKGVVVRTFPQIPGGEPRCYPSTGSAVLLPLRNLNATLLEAEVLVCGGSPRGSFQRAAKGEFLKALNTCARMKITDPDPKWVMETMPGPRVMSDMVMLPNGNVLIINGATSGSGGWEFGRDPILSPVLYKTNNPIGSRFETQNPSNTPRMYHSTVVLVRDGRVLVGGSNPHMGYNFSQVLFPTELSLEAFSPSYLDPTFSNIRPRIVFPIPEFQLKLNYNQRVDIFFQVDKNIRLEKNLVYATMLAPPFNTHSFSMNQRLLVLEPNSVTYIDKTKVYVIEVTMPRSPIVAPPGFYLLFVVHEEIPSEGMWIQIL